VWHGRPLLESGTLGTKCNVQVVLPFKTESYADSVDPPEESIPMCTLKNFPHLPEHCMEWARDLFAGQFTNPVSEAAAFIREPAAWLRRNSEEALSAQRRKNAEGVLRTLTDFAAPTPEQCARAAVQLFHRVFTLDIAQLLHSFPPDYKDKDSGMPFWTGVKRAPTPAAFNPRDELHRAFIASAARLFGDNFGVRFPPGFDPVAAAAAVALPPFAPKAVTIATNEKDKAAVDVAEDDEPAIAAARAALTALAAEFAAGRPAPALAPAEFEKDDDANGHIDFLTAATNLRSVNYAIKTSDRHKVKVVTGKIIPAVATTTNAVTGLVCIEFFKVVAGKPLDAFKNAFCNLAINTYQLAEPAGPKRVTSKKHCPVAMGPIKAVPEGHSRWDKTVIREGRDLTFKELGQWFKDKMGLTMSSVVVGQFSCYSSFSKDHVRDRSDRRILDQMKTYEKFHMPHSNWLELSCSLEDDDGAECVIPPVVYFFS